MLGVTMMIEMLGLRRTALVTDGRFSGATAGPCVGHVSLEVSLSDQVIAGRLANVRPVDKPAVGYMRRYRRLVSSSARGAILE